MALRSMEQMNVDLGIFTETKLTGGIYPRHGCGYNVTATEATSPHSGGIALFYRDSDYWQVESIEKHGPNVISFVLVTGRKRIPVVGAYVPPSDTDTLGFIEQALDRFPGRGKPLLMGDLNANLLYPRDARDEEIADLAANYGLDDLLSHFWQRRGKRHDTTWRQQRNDGIIRSRCDYILGSDRRMFINMAIRDPRLYSSDHYCIVGDLRSSTLKCNRAYLRGRKRSPLRPPKWGPKTRVDTLFQEMKDAAEHRRPDKAPSCSLGIGIYLEISR